MKDEELPKFESRKYYLTRKYKDMYNLQRFDRPDNRGTKYWKIKDRILHYYIGKSFDDAFSHYCTLVPKDYQHLFLEAFENPFSRWSEWDLDDNKNIIHIKRDRYISNSEWREILRNKQEKYDESRIQS